MEANAAIIQTEIKDLAHWHAFLINRARTRTELGRRIMDLKMARTARRQIASLKNLQRQERMAA